TGSQVDVVRKWNPNFWMASEDPRQSCQPVKMMSTTTAIAMARVSHWNALSPKREGGAIARATDRGSSGATAGGVAISMRAHITFLSRLSGSGHVAEGSPAAAHIGGLLPFSRRLSPPTLKIPPA